MLRYDFLTIRVSKSIKKIIKIVFKNCMQFLAYTNFFKKIMKKVHFETLPTHHKRRREKKTISQKLIADNKFI
jgi:hypothetical protein